MTSKEIRNAFLNFFKEKEHLIVPSAPLVLKNDPTLMFTNSGMAQFKDFFLGNKIPPAKRIADTQKCLRVSGKHNDLEDVGLDTYHHTMFEMLGNWSFGDYFKKDALDWSWELLTKVYKLPKNRLYVSVFGGDEKENLSMDQEAYDIWKSMVDESHIILGNKKDNFWEMGESGPCGPCSEIHIDLRSEEEIAKKSGRELVNNDHPQVVEIWNNVFMQFERMANGSLRALPDKHVDTGMGFERLCMAIQQKTSNYDTDVFQPLIQFIAKKASKVYGNDEKTDIALRVVSDHIRAIAFTIADGQLPSNNKAGYVIRRILRRAVRYGYTYLNFKEPFLHLLVPILANQFEDVFPELKAQEDFIKRVILEEENSFLKTLDTGLKLMDEIILKNKKNNIQIIDGKTVFELYDTFGFPLDLTALVARENGFTIDEVSFNEELKIQKDRSKQDAVKETGDWIILNKGDESRFIGYDETETISQILKYRKVKIKEKTLFQLVLDETPFYAESGGQVGDTGELIFKADETKKIKITDTKKENDLTIHLTADDIENLDQLLNTPVLSKISGTKRKLTNNNHSATHLMHAALKEVLGMHVNQKGSLVNESALRFDFSHFAKLSDDEIAKVEKIVNLKIRENILLDEKRNVPIQKAKEFGAMALFGEKYGDFVRVITFDNKFSIELCGGTHVKATGEIGLFKIISETAVAAGVRRIEAVTAFEAENLINDQLNILNEVKEILKNPKDLKKAVNDLLEEKNKLQKQIEVFQFDQINILKEDLLKKIIKKDGINILIEKIKLPTSESLKQLAYDIKAVSEPLYLVLAAEIDGKPQIAVMLSDIIIKEKNLNAVQIVKELAKEIKGGGGGQPFFATAGGIDLDGLDRVVEKGRSF